MTNEQIKNKLIEAKKLKRIIEITKEKILILEDEIKSELILRGTDTIIIDEYKITYKNVISSHIDTTSIKKSMPEVAKQFTKTKTVKKFCII